MKFETWRKRSITQARFLRFVIEQELKLAFRNVLSLAKVTLAQVETKIGDSQQHQVSMKSRRYIISYLFAALVGSHWTGAD